MILTLTQTDNYQIMINLLIINKIKNNHKTNKYISIFNNLDNNIYKISNKIIIDWKK